MAYSTAARSEHFRRFHGSSATRANSRGHSEFGDPALLPAVKEQYEATKKAARDLSRRLESGLPSAEREIVRRQLAEKVRALGPMRDILHNGARYHFEKIFSQVASIRLPKDKFLTLVDEAREIWRSEGYADLIPPLNNKERRRAEKRALKLL